MGHFQVSPIPTASGVAYLFMALTVWSMLRDGPHARAVRFWALGSALAGCGALLVAARSVVPDLAGYSLSACLAAAALVAHIQALRVHGGMPARGRLLLLLWLLGCAVNVADMVWGSIALHISLSTSMLVVCALALAWHARQVAVANRSAIAGLLAWSHVVLALAMLQRSVVVAMGWSVPAQSDGGLDYVLVHAAVALTSIYGNLGFLGMVLEITRRAEADAQEARGAERVRREQAEDSAQALAALLAQRDRLATERERMLALLADEIRQPLHNAGGALQAAGHALRALPAAPGAPAVAAVGSGLQRAETLLGAMRAVLDNALAAATMSNRRAPLAVQEVALDFLVELALGDLAVMQRRQVRVQWQTGLRDVDVEPGLLRLALRNLLVNALSHGGTQVSVQLQVAEQTQPPALLLRVVDDGPGLVAGTVPALPDARRQGMGLDIVRQVMGLHGGRLELLPQAPQGLAAVLVLPLPPA